VQARSETTTERDSGSEQTLEDGSGGGDATAAITVRVGCLPDGDGFYVADDGAGIPAAKRDQVFEHGYSEREQGTGFGLSIVHSIVDAHGWSIRIAESWADGARFEIVVDD
jgi:signal transduction histidine kinase